MLGPPHPTRSPGPGRVTSKVTSGLTTKTASYERGHTIMTILGSRSILAALCLLGSLSLAAQQQRPASPARAAASQTPVEVSIAGVRVVGAGYGANGSELRAFNERPGTTIALALQAQAGAGIVEIDSHASRVESFADDKGQGLLEEARVGSFPRIAEDRGAAIVEVGVQARPSAGAASVSTQGSVAMTLAGGSKPQRISNVKLEAGQTMKLGTATVSLKSANASGDESTAVGLAMT